METGQKYNRLTAVKLVRKDENYFSWWLFKCDCGGEIITRKDRVKYGQTRSCGCLKKESEIRIARVMGLNSATHGLYKGVAHNPSGIDLVYRSIVQRCKDKSHPAYKNYGDRGIKCLWKSVDEFKRDMEYSYKEHIEKYGQKNTQIDRTDNNKDYSKENCRWVTRKENMRNTRNTSYFKGISIAEFSEKTGIARNNLYTRKNKGWDDDEILTGEHSKKIGEKAPGEKNLIDFKKYIMENFRKSADVILAYLSALDDREQDILKRRLGLVDGKRETLEDIGKDKGLTRERVRQIEFKALQKIAQLDSDLMMK